MNKIKHSLIRLPAIGLVIALAVTHGSAAKPTRDYPVTTVPLNKVEITDGFWRQRLDTHFQATIDHALEQCEQTGRIDNFRITAGEKQGEHQGASFNDSDVYKIIEGIADSLNGPLKPEHRKFLDEFIGLLKKGQMDDGYLFTFYQVNKTLDQRWSNIGQMHELYCAGHLFEAGAAHYRMTGKRDLLDVCLKFADHIDQTFGPGKKEEVPGHAEIELALADLYRITGEKRYLDLARYFLEQRGRRPANWYDQQHQPMLDGGEAVGHAVRAVYAYCGMAEVAALSGDPSYTKALESYWQSVTGSKMAISGGIGGGLWESFDKPYFLPNRSSYNETCGAISQVLWNHRMFRLTGDGKYLDVLERALYNGVLTGVQLSGDAFFYPNPLESGPVKRQPWFDCACCPSNIARFIPAQPGYLYATDGETLFTCLYASSRCETEIAGTKVQITQKTDYPWDGSITLVVKPDLAKSFTLALRIPGWAHNEPVPTDLYHYLGKPDRAPVLKLNGKPMKPEFSKGFARLKRTWQPGDTVTLSLPLPVRMLVANDKVKENKGRVALERGPIVYCVEGIDNDKLASPQNLLIEADTSFSSEFHKDLLGGVSVITGKADLVKRGSDGKSIDRETRKFTAVPYFARANRDATPMAVFLLRDPAAAVLPPVPSLATAAKVSSSTGNGNFAALSDQIIPARSADASQGIFSWDGREGSTEWVQYEFEKPQIISSSSVYWYDRFGKAQRLPKAWRLLYRDGEDWKPVAVSGTYGLETDKPNAVRFEPIKTSALRLETDLQDAFLDPYLAAPDAKPAKFSAGLLEWGVE